MEYLKSIMKKIKELRVDEFTADTALIDAIKCEMTEKLADARQNGRAGWWNDDVCDIEYLYQLREKSISDGDHISVINYTAMIAARESIEQEIINVWHF